ncbi:hypothetical protein BLNAU_9940 [Blattamonas nauphoetae]|uniref:Uncharacterized protein n=1 Tax=Blattamonas nauphoetae TaxID=2049346 RepID=A0ABQ9XU63_9EUKA|nr:hypothetical protein BLNAU_9940 [Blattamonas nauphoetae]
MTEINPKIDTSSRAARSDLSSTPLQPVLDVSLEAQAVKFLKSLDPEDGDSIDAFLSHDGPATDESLRVFVQSIVVLISSASERTITATMEMLDSLILLSSTHFKLALVKADLIPQLINALKPQSLSFTESVDIHINVMKSIRRFLWLATPGAQADLKLEDGDEQRAVQKTVLQQVLVPSEQYLCHLCMSRFSIIGRQLSEEFSFLLPAFVQIPPYYQPTMDIVLNMPVFLTIPSCLTFFETEFSNWMFLVDMNRIQRVWNKQKEEFQQMGNAVHRMLRMEAIEDVIEEKLRNDQNKTFGKYIVDDSIRWNNLLGMNLPKPE